MTSCKDPQHRELLVVDHRSYPAIRFGVYVAEVDGGTVRVVIATDGRFARAPG